MAVPLQAKKLSLRCAVVVAVGLTAVSAQADTVNARCDIFARGSDKASLVTACTFSQRQGFIGVQLPQGTRYDFSPQDGPGRYTDQDGNPATRHKGLGTRGMIFRMKTQTLHVYWSTAGLKPSAPDTTQVARSAAAAKTLLTLPEASVPFALTYCWGKIQFKVESANLPGHAPGHNTVRITPSGLTIDNQSLERQISGQLVRGEVADINRDGSPELYLYVRSSDALPRTQLLAFSVNRGKSMSDIYLAPLSARPDLTNGYRGWDQFAVVESALVQRFPVFADQAADSEPSAVRQIRYRLRQGEASWQLVADKADEF